MNKKILTFIASCFVCAASLLTGCTVGLGEAVDTQPPTVDISYPEVSVVIKDWFIMTGTCDDETSIDYVDIALKNTATKKIWGPSGPNTTYRAVLNEDCTAWSCKINEADEDGNFPIPDGDYEVTVTAFDKAGRHQDSKRQFKIDNTEPVIFLSNPSSVETSTQGTSVYGVKIEVEGSAADANDISTLVYSVYTNDGTFIKSESVSNISQGLGVTISQYLKESDGATAEEIAQSFYNQIYGTMGEKVETKYFKYKICLIDAAKNYQDASIPEGTGTGNKTKGYYLYEEVYKSLSGKSAKDIYNFMNGTVNDSKNILSKIKPFMHESDDENTEQAAVGTFGLNPMNNPTYVVQSFDAFDSTKETPWSSCQISSSGKINILTTPGLSNTPLEPDTFSVVIYPVDENGAKAAGAVETTIPHELGNKSGSSWPISVLLSSEYVTVAEHYGIEVRGNDQDGLEFNNGTTVYRFVVQNGATPPTVNVLTVDGIEYSSAGTIYHKAGDALVISGTALSKSGSAKGHVDIYPVINSGEKVTALKASTVSNTENQWTMTIPASYFTAEDDNYAITLAAYDEIKNPNESTIVSIFYDDEAPKVEFTSGDDLCVVYEADTELTDGTNTFTALAGIPYVNGSFTVKCAISDNGAFKSAEWTAKAGEKLLDSGTVTTNSCTITIDTTKGDNEKNLTITLKVVDKAGNEQSYIYKHKDEKIPVIHQITDMPVFSPTNFSLDITAQSDISEDSNLFTQAQKLTGAVTDDDGLAGLYLYYTQNLSCGTTKADLDAAVVNSMADTAWGYAYYDCKKKTSFSLSQSLKYMLETTYKLMAKAVDINGNEMIVGPLVIAISNNAPAIAVTSEQNGWEGNSVTVNGTITSTSPIKTVTCAHGNAGVAVTAVSLTNNNTKWSNTFTSASDGETVTYTVTDIYGRSSDATFAYKVDKASPTFAPDLVQPAVAWQNSSACTISIPVSDEWNVSAKTKYQSASGIVAVTGIIDGDSENPVALSNTGKKYVQTAESKTANGDFTTDKLYTIYSTTQSLGDGEHTIVVSAEDDAGNKTASTKSYTFKVDTKAPVISSITPDTNHPSGVNQSNVDKSFYWDVVLGDANGAVSVSKVSSIEVYEGSVADEHKLTSGITITNTSGTAVSAPYNDGTYRVNFAKSVLTTGAHTFIVVAKDTAGNIAQQSGTVNIDVTPPALTINGFSPYVSIIEGGNEKHYANGTITVSFVATDETALGTTSSLEWAVKSSDLATTYKTGSVNLKGSTYENGTFDINTAEMSESPAARVIPDGTYKLVITLKDRVANTNVHNTTVLNIDQNTDKPTVVLSNADINLTNTAEISSADLHNLFGNGSNVIYGTAEDDDGIKSIAYTIDSGKSSVINGSISVSGNPTTKTFQLDLSTVKAGSVITSGAHTISFTVTDKNGLAVTYPAGDPMVFAYDNDLPKITVSTLNSTAYSYNMWAPSNFDVVGTATDGSGVKKVYLKSDAGKTTLVTSGAETASAAWKHSVSGQTQDGTVSYIVEDIYGRTFETAISYKVDTEKPTLDSSYIYISGTIIENGVSKTYEKSISAYSAEASSIWFANSAIKIEGKGTAEHPAIVEQYPDSVTVTAAGSSSSPNLGTNNNFSTTVSLNEGSNTISIAATDKAGNSSTTLAVNCNVDSVAPVISSVSHNAGTITKNANITVTYNVNDVTSGISKVEVFKDSSFNTLLKSETINIAASATPTQKTITVPTANLDQGSNTLAVRITDKAGNKNYQNLVAFTFDNVAPVVTYTSPAAGNTVHKKINLVASVADANVASGLSQLNVELKYKNSTVGTFTTVSEEWYGDVTFASNICTITNLDTSKFSDDTTTFILIVKDAAGNVVNESTGNVLTLNISQDSDRPEITLNTINTNGSTTLSSGVISGTVSDTDGLNKLYIQITTDSASVAADDSWIEVSSIAGTNWTYNYSKGTGVALDGSYKLWFKVTDNNPTPGTFISGNSSSLNCPKISYAGGAAISTAVLFSIDENPPSITKFEYQTKDDGGSDFTEWADVNINALLGGKKFRYVKFRALAYDAVSEQNLTVKVSLAGSSHNMTINDSGDSVESNFYFESEEIDLHEVTSNSYSVSVSAADAADKPTTNSLTVIVDNTAPTVVDHVTPSASQEQSGNPVIRGQMNDGNGSGVSAIQYAIPTDSQSSTSEISEWHDTTESTSSTWNIEISSTQLLSSGTTMKSEYQGYGSEGIYEIPVWFKMTDNAGNIGYNTTSAVIRYNPDSDRPSVEISYPVEGDEGYIEMGGTIRIQGSADDDEGIGAIYLQFDMDGDYSYENGVSVDGAPSLTLTNLITDKGTSSAKVGDEVSTVPAGATAVQVVKVAENKKNFSYSVNISSLTGVLKGTNNKTMNVRAIAVDSDSGSKLVSAWSKVLHISVNNGAPTFAESYIKQYSGSTELTSIDYASGKFISGSGWYLEGVIGTSATQGIDQIIITNTDNGNDVAYLKTDSSHTSAGLVKSWFTAGTQSYSYKIPLSEVPSAFTITATDATDNKNTSHNDYIVNLDNNAPEFSDVEADYATSKKIKVYKNNYGKNGTVISNTETIQNYDGSLFTLTGRIAEPTNESGFERMAFYFKRTGSSNRIYDPMIAHGNSNANKTVIAASKTADSVYINEQNLPALYLTGVTRGDTTELTSSTLENTTFVRPGHLVKIGGQYRLITRVDKASGTVEFTPGCDTEKYTDAEIIYAQVIDHTGESLDSNNEVKSSTDDGDGMLETYVKNADKYTWEASVNTNNIPDGPIEVHFVVFDAAGNSRHGKFESRITNSAPRIARVGLGTDFNGNGECDDSEISTFASSNTTKGVEICNLTADAVSNWKIKKDLYVKPEIVGGTAPFYYIVGASAADIETPATEPNLKTSGKTFASSNSVFKIANANIGGTEDNTNTYNITIWDSTEELVPGSTTVSQQSQYAIINAQLFKDIADGNKPTVVREDFFWTDKDHNSLYDNSTANGHIELEALSSNTGLNDNLKDSDPKVSGKIVIRGYAYDDVRLSSIWINFDGFTFSNHLGGDDGKVTISEVEYRQAAFYHSSAWGENNANAAGWQSAGATMATDGWEFNVITEGDGTYFDQRGHKVRWELAIDTSRVAITSTTGLNSKFRLLAFDHPVEAPATNNMSLTTEEKSPGDGTYNIPAYQMDIVPYVTGIQTRLGNKKITNPSTYGRTAKGKYSVSSDETINIFGFNLSGCKVVDSTGTTEVDFDNTQVSNAKFEYFGGNQCYAIAVSSFTSGNIKVVNKTNGTLVSLNNYNNNNAKGSYSKTDSSAIGTYSILNEGYYNRKPNNDSNNLLTDDTSLEIWQINSNAATSASIALKYPVMHINPSNDQIGFGFVKGGDSVSFPANGYSYVWYQKNNKDYVGTNFVYDTKGVAHTISTGVDAQTSTGIAGRMNYNNSTWYDETNNNGTNRKRQWSTVYNVAMETIGIPNGIYVKGTQVNVGNGEKGIIDVDRFATPAMAVATHGNNTAVYTVYYDNDHDQLRFRYGLVPNNGTTRGSNNFGLLNDSKSERHRHNNTNNTSIPNDTTNDSTGWDTHGMFEASKDYYALLAGQYYRQTNDKLTGTVGALYNDTGNHGSEHYAIGVIPGESLDEDVVVFVWFDPTVSELKFTYREKLTTDGDNTDASSSGISNKWGATKTIYSGALQNVSLAVDKNNGIHIVAYEQNNADLLYFYLPVYTHLNTTGNKAYVKTVDAYSQIGSFATIDTALNASGKVVPYISYFAEGLSALPKLAYLPNGIDSTSAATITSSLVNGADQTTGLFTGEWEVSVIPSSSTLQKYNVNIGVWKDSDGKAKAGNNKASKDADVATSTDQRKRYGNGISNYVVGYAIRNGNGYIETAMIK